MSCEVRKDGRLMIVTCGRGRRMRYLCDVPPHDKIDSPAVGRCDKHALDLCPKHAQEHYHETGCKWRRIA